MNGHRILLPPRRDIQHTRALDGDRFLFVRGPLDRVMDQLAVIDRHHFPESPIDIPRKVHDTGRAALERKNSRDIRLRHAWIDHFHGKIRIRGHQSERWMAELRGRTHVQSPCPVDDAPRIFQTRQDRVIALRRRILFYAQVGVPHGPFCGACGGHAEKVGKPEVRPPHSPLVVERRFECRQKTPAAADIVAQLLTLAVRQRGDVRQDQQLEPVDLCRIEKPVVNHLERDTRFDQRLVEAQRMIFQFLLRSLAAVERGSLLGVHQRDPRQWLLVTQVALRPVMPLVDVFDDLQPAPVVERSGELREPRP